MEAKNEIGVCSANVNGEIESRILTVRGMQVMLDRDLAELYGVPTKALNQAVKRNSERFPERFMYPLTKSEVRELVTNCDHRSCDVQRAVPGAERDLPRELPRPLSDSRRSRALLDRRVAEGPRPEVLRLHETGRVGDFRVEGADMILHPRPGTAALQLTIPHSGV